MSFDQRVWSPTGSISQKDGGLSPRGDCPRQLGFEKSPNFLEEPWKGRFAFKDQMVAALQRHEPGSGNTRSKPAARIERYARIVTSVHHEGWVFVPAASRAASWNGGGPGCRWFEATPRLGSQSSRSPPLSPASPPQTQSGHQSQETFRIERPP